MITIPLYIILFIYLAYLAVLMIFYYINLSHLIHNGALTIISFSITIFIIFLNATALFFTYALLNSVDWQQPLTLWNSSWITNALNLSI